MPASAPGVTVLRPPSTTATPSPAGEPNGSAGSGDRMTLDRPAEPAAASNAACFTGESPSSSPAAIEMAEVARGRTPVGRARQRALRPAKQGVRPHRRGRGAEVVPIPRRVVRPARHFIIIPRL